MEIWKPIHDGWYEVSDYGNIRRAKAGRSTFIGRPVLSIPSSTGYMQVHLGGGSNRRAYVHHLVIEAFLGARPDGYVINHKDGNKSNNCLLNLEYVTPKQNAIHAVNEIGRRKGPKMDKKPLKGRPTGDSHWSKKHPEKIARGDKMPHCKLTPETVALAKLRVADGEMQKNVALDIGISVAQMSRIIRGTRWTYL